MASEPSRAEVWTADLDPTRGHEQAGVRPCLVVSVDGFNQGPAELVIVLPLTSRFKRIPSHVELNPPEGGLSHRSFIKCEDVRSVSKRRLRDCRGKVSTPTMASVEDRLRILLGL